MKIFSKKKPEPEESKLVKFFICFTEESLKPFFKSDDQINVYPECYVGHYLPRKGDHVDLPMVLDFVDWSQVDSPFTNAKTVVSIQLHSDPVVEYVWHDLTTPFQKREFGRELAIPTVGLGMPEDSELRFDKIKQNRYHKTKPDA